MTRVGYAFLLLFGIVIQMVSMTSVVATKMVDWKLFKCEDGKQPGGFTIDQLSNLAPKFNITDTIDSTDVVNKVENFFQGLLNSGKNIYDIIAVETQNPGVDADGKPLQQRDAKCLYEAGYFVVYRVAFANFLFFTTFALLMIGVKSSADPRGGLQNGFWGAKFVIILATMIGCLFIPAGGFDNVVFVIGLIAALLFILWQLLLLVDFAHNMNEWLLSKMDEDSENEKMWKGVLMFLSFGQYVAAFIGIVLMFVYFGPSGCSLHQFYISMALIISLVCGIVATNNTVQEANEQSGILQAATVSLYLCYMTYSAMTSNIDPQYATCNPTMKVSPLFMGLSGLQLMNGSSIFGMALAVVLVLYSTVSAAGVTTGGSSGSTSSDMPMLEAGEGGDNGKGQVQDDETNKVAYSYTYYHTTMVLGTLYCMMILTNWQNPDNKNLPNMWPVVWIKVTSAWLAAILYTWTLVAPLVLPDRDWS